MQRTLRRAENVIVYVFILPVKLHNKRSLTGKINTSHLHLFIRMTIGIEMLCEWKTGQVNVH